MTFRLWRCWTLSGSSVCYYTYSRQARKLCQISSSRANICNIPVKRVNHDHFIHLFISSYLQGHTQYGKPHDGEGGERCSQCCSPLLPSSPLHTHSPLCSPCFLTLVVMLHTVTGHRGDIYLNGWCLENIHYKSTTLQREIFELFAPSQIGYEWNPQAVHRSK